MSYNNMITAEDLQITVDASGRSVGVSAWVRDAAGAGGAGESDREAALVFLHGFGSTKEDYFDVGCRREFDGYTIVAFDFPGCGASDLPRGREGSIPFYREVARGVLDRLRIERCHLVGHSMGGLTGLLLAHDDPDRIASLVSVEGNLVPEDCFLSRQVYEYPETNADDFLASFIGRLRRQPAFGLGPYVAALPHKVRADVVQPLFRSIVEWSDDGDLLNTFLELPTPRLFVYGDRNRDLPHLPRLRAAGIELAEISGSGHFPMYSNPVALWEELYRFTERVEERSAPGGARKSGRPGSR